MHADISRTANVTDNPSAHVHRVNFYSVLVPNRSFFHPSSRWSSAVRPPVLFFPRMPYLFALYIITLLQPLSPRDWINRVDNCDDERVIETVVQTRCKRKRESATRTLLPRIVGPLFPTIARLKRKLRRIKRFFFFFYFFRWMADDETLLILRSYTSYYNWTS